MIVKGLLGSLRIDVEDHIPTKSPFSCLGTRPTLDMAAVHRNFSLANTLLVTAPTPRRSSAAGLISATLPKPTSPDADMTLKVVKVGLLSRKGV